MLLTKSFFKYRAIPLIECTAKVEAGRGMAYGDVFVIFQAEGGSQMKVRMSQDEAAALGAGLLQAAQPAKPPTP